MEIVTARLRLRPITASDADDVAALNDDLRVRRYLGTLEPSASIFARWQAERYRWIARDGADFVGTFGLRETAPDEYELGYRLSARTWGCGYGTEGARAVVDHAFDVLGARRVWGQTMAVNGASRRVMEKAGLRFVRSFAHAYDEVVDGSEHGDVEYDLRRGKQGT